MIIVPSNKFYGTTEKEQIFKDDRGTLYKGGEVL